jgi:hypothetical protein
MVCPFFLVKKAFSSYRNSLVLWQLMTYQVKELNIRYHQYESYKTFVDFVQYLKQCQVQQHDRYYLDNHNHDI